MMAANTGLLGFVSIISSNAHKNPMRWILLLPHFAEMKQRLRRSKNFAQGHTASKQQSPNSNPSLWGSNPIPFLLLHTTFLNGYKRRSFLYRNTWKNKQFGLVDL